MCTTIHTLAVALGLTYALTSYPCILQCQLHLVRKRQWDMWDVQYTRVGWEAQPAHCLIGRRHTRVAGPRVGFTKLARARPEETGCTEPRDQLCKTDENAESDEMQMPCM